MLNSTRHLQLLKAANIRNFDIAKKDGRLRCFTTIIASYQKPQRANHMVSAMSGGKEARDLGVWRVELRRE